MDLTQLTSSDLKAIAGLLEKKEELEAQIEEINARLKSYQSGAAAETPRRAKTSSPRAASSPASAPAAGKTPRGQLKEKIVSALQGAGNEGITVKGLADRLGTTYGNIYAFFQTTGKRIDQIKKIAPGTFAWVA